MNDGKHIWEAARGLGGDSWADEVGRSQEVLNQQTVKDTKLYGEEDHEITLAEYADLLEFCSRGHLVVEVRAEADPDAPLAQLYQDGTETYPNRGQIHCPEFSNSS